MFVKNKSEHHKGFTLLELLVVIAIVSIIAVVSFEMLSRAKENTQEESACNDIAALINKTRSYALTGKCSGGSAMTVTMTLSGNMVTITDDGGNCNESLPLPHADICEGGTWKFGIPAGNKKAGPVSMGCGDSKMVVVDAYKATCQ